jgi:hypothetical protein
MDRLLQNSISFESGQEEEGDSKLKPTYDSQSRIRLHNMRQKLKENNREVVFQATKRFDSLQPREYDF